MKPLLTSAVLIAGTLIGVANAAQQQPVQTQQFRPKWNVGDQWTIETQSRQQQVATRQTRRVVAQWRFTVEAVDQVQGKPCFRIVIRPVDAPQPKTIVWVEQNTTAIRQIQTQLPTADGYKTVTESYRGGGRAAPVVGPLTVLPIDLPQFPQPGMKDLGTYQYETISGPGGIKAVGDVGFSTEIRQRFSKPSAQLMKGILGDEGIKNIDNRPVVEVELKTPDETVRQVWVANSPWPLFADNGVTQSRLIATKRATGQTPRRGRIIAPPQASPDRDEGIKALAANGGSERAAAKTKPWSGYWWPIHEGRLLVPLGKYDRLTGHRAAVWERKHNPPGPDVPKWFGYCHAWAAAAMLEKEPLAKRVLQMLTLGVGDIKGLLTACHTEDLANSWGDRFGDGQGSEDPQDLRPDRLWRLLKLHLKQQGVALVLDVEAGDEVWNYPVYQYEISYQPTSGGKYLANLTLVMADDGVAADYRGTKPRKQTYQFTFKMRGGNVISGSGQWVGRSRKDHPDFAWYPYKAVATNPEVKYPKVQKLASASPSQPPTPVTPPTPDTPPSPTTPPAIPPTTPAQPTPVTPPTTVTPPAPPVTTPAAEAPPAPEQPAGPIVVSPMELVALIANRTSSFEFDATIDRFDGASYKPGEVFSMRVKSERPGYLYLLQVDSTGTPSLLYPTAGEDNRIPGGKLIEIKPAGAAGGFPVVGPAGIVRVKAVVTSRPLAFSGSLASLQNQQQQTQARPVQFRWHPTQRRQIKQLLTQKQQTNAQQLGCRKPQDILGPFAQDMTTFYIDTKK